MHAGQDDSGVAQETTFADGNGAQASSAGELLGAGVMCDEPYVRSKHAIVPDRHQEAVAGVDEDAVLKGYVGPQHETAAAQCVEIKGKRDLPALRDQLPGPPNERGN